MNPSFFIVDDSRAIQAIIKRSIDASIGQLSNATKSTREEIALREREKGELEADLTHWGLDVQAAGRTAQRFASRLEAVRTSLSATENSVVDLGRQLTDAMEGRILGFNVGVAHVWADQEHLLEQTGRRMPVEDSYIAATARRHNLTIVTGNEKDFRRPGIKVFNPFKEPGVEIG
jgi:predicted nucleic acid-binding protein